MAQCYMRGEALGHSRKTTALVNAAYLRLIDQRDVRLAEPRAVLRLFRPN